MILGMDERRICKSGLPAAVALLGLFVVGCNSGTPSADQALNKSLETTGATKQNLGKFSGIVTVDGKPPENAGLSRIFVILCDPKKPSKSNTSPPYAACDEGGKFEFTTYHDGDGVPTGSYVVCFAQLEGGLRLGGKRGLRGPDHLKNLYNDPDKNKDVKEFQVEVTSPGKVDWDFNLQVSGKEPVPTPGPNAFTELH
jgi:hypothetical protein